MRFLVDECTGPKVAQWLIDQKHEVLSVYDDYRGVDDDYILRKAFDENWILITTDKDFGEKVYRDRQPHRGIILLRLIDHRSVVKIKTLKRLIHNYRNRLAGSFVVVSETKVRFARQ